MKLWIVGQNTAEDPYAEGAKSWEFVGVYSSEHLAVDACGTERHFVGLVTLDDTLPDETVEWPHAYYPKAAQQ